MILVVLVSYVQTIHRDQEKAGLAGSPRRPQWVGGSAHDHGAALPMIVVTFSGITTKMLHDHD
jgi:hypothetical protein